MNELRPIVVANFKAHKTWDEMESWIDQVSPRASEFAGTIIICPSSPFLTSAYSKLQTSSFAKATEGKQNSKLKLGAQDISKFEQGPYTGEVSASQVAKICKYAI